MSNILIIGYGNSLRGDDSVGQVVASSVEQWYLPNVKVLSLHQLAPELADDLAQAETIYFIDASSDVTLEHPRVKEIQSNHASVNVSHFSSPENLLALTRQLYGCEPRVYLIEIPAESFELSEGLSAKAQKGVREVLEYLRDTLNAMQVTNQVVLSEKLRQLL